MKHRLIILLAALPFAAVAQAPAGNAATKTEASAVTSIVECLAPGLPEDWTEAVMVIQLDKPLESTGAVQYLFSREAGKAPDERFIPCDVRRPAVELIDARKLQPAAQRGWTGARLTVHRDGKFNLKYEYPKPAAK